MQTLKLLKNLFVSKSPLHIAKKISSAVLLCSPIFLNISCFKPDVTGLLAGNTVNSGALELFSTDTDFDEENGYDAFLAWQEARGIDRNIVINNIVLSKTKMRVVISAETVISGKETSGSFISGRIVRIRPYMIGKYPVTQQLFEAVMGINPSVFSSSPFSGESQRLRPVEHVSWYDAITFCNKLSLIMDLPLCYSVTVNGEEVDWENITYDEIPTHSDTDWDDALCNDSVDGFRLPFEVEWELAARGGDPTDTKNWNYRYAGSDNIRKSSWYGEVATHAVGKKIGNSLDLYDMSGNLWEWCWDRYGNITDDSSIYGSDSGFGRSLRGGSWLGAEEDCSVAVRGYSAPRFRDSLFGIRLARTLLTGE